MELDVELDSIEVKPEAALRKEVGDLCLVDWGSQVKHAYTSVREK